MFPIATYLLILALKVKKISVSIRLFIIEFSKSLIIAFKFCIIFSIHTSF